MNDPQLAPFETAARIYCEKVGMNPDDVTRTPHPLIAGMAVEQPVWHSVAERLRDLSMLLTSLRAAAEKAKKGDGRVLS